MILTCLGIQKLRNFGGFRKEEVGDEGGDGDVVREKAETRNVQDEGAESDRHYSLPAAVWHWVELPRSVATPLLIGID